jgi:hypothetical protein
LAGAFFAAGFFFGASAGGSARAALLAEELGEAGVSPAAAGGFLTTRFEPVGRSTARCGSSTGRFFNRFDRR